ncbi:hypothetical protein DPSP01_013930 [Paraphaeosphaeria sporulosa]
MHASLILLIVSLATSAVAAPVPVVAQFDSPELLMVGEVDVLKREILKRLEAIAKRGAPQGYEGNVEVYDARDGGRPSFASSGNDKRAGDQNYELSNDNRSDYSLEVGPSHNKRDGGRPVFAPKGNDKRDGGRPVFAPKGNDKRDSGEDFVSSNASTE